MYQLTSKVGHFDSAHKIEDYQGALVHDDCLEIFTVIDNCLCILDGNRWQDVKTKEYKEVRDD